MPLKSHLRKIGPPTHFWKINDRGLKDSSFERKFITDHNYINLKVIWGHTRSRQAKIHHEKHEKFGNRAKKFFTSVGVSLQVRTMQLISTHLSGSRIDGNFLDRSSRSTPTHSRADWNFTFEGCFSPIKCVGGSLEITWIAQNDPLNVLLMGQ